MPSNSKSASRTPIGHPLLFEIGRDGLVELAAAQVAVPAAAAGVRTAATPASAVAQSVAATRQAETRVTYAILAGIVFLMLGVVMVVGKPGPAMLAAQRWWSSTGPVAAASCPPPSRPRRQPPAPRRRPARNARPSPSPCCRRRRWVSRPAW